MVFEVLTIFLKIVTDKFRISDKNEAIRQGVVGNKTAVIRELKV